MSSMGKTIFCIEKNQKMSNFVRFCIVYSVICFLSLFVGGCGSELADIAGGAAGGIGIKNTLEGMQADLQIREQALINRYNELVEAGAKAETLEDLKQQIADTVRLRQGAQVADSVAATNWNDPAAAGASVAAILATAYAFIKRRDLTNTVAGVKTFRAKADEATKHQLDQIMLDKKATT